MSVNETWYAVRGVLTQKQLDRLPPQVYAELQVFDPAEKIQNPQGDGLIYVPPSGHVAGVYARVDTQRGVHKAPANETVRGALG